MQEVKYSEREQSFLTEVSARVSAAMEASGLVTQRLLADASGISQPQISRILRGSVDSSVLTLSSLAAALKVPLAALLPEGPVVSDLPSERPRVSALTVAADRRLTDLQRTLLNMATQLSLDKKLSNHECLELISAWLPRLEGIDQSKGLGK